MDNVGTTELQGYLLIYIFVCFSVGIACLGVTVVSAKRKDDTLARAFLVFYLSVSLLVIGALLRAFIDILPAPVEPSTRFLIEYLDSFIGRYGMMFALPFFAHRVFAVVDARRDYLIAAIVAVAALIQHVTEFWLSKAWDDRGDLFEDVLLAGIGVYTLGLGFAHLGNPRVYRPLAVRFLALLSIGVPGGIYDIFLSDDTALKFFPLGYCVGSVVITWTLIQRRSSFRPGAIPPQWGLSQREAEVAGLVLRGLSNKEIADQLNISPNTVKTHLRAVFDKSGVSSRYELISAGSQESSSETGL